MSNKNRNKCLILHNAVKDDAYYTVKELVDQGYLESEAKADVFYTSLDYALRNTRMLELLLNAGASTAGKNFNRQTPLIRAMGKNYFSAVDTMLSMYDVDSIDPTNKNDMIHFIIAAIRGKRELVGCFIQKGFNVNAVFSSYLDDWTAYTPLHCVVKHLSVDGVKILLEFGANVTIQDKDGFSPLHLAYYIWKNKKKSDIHESYWRHDDGEKDLPIRIIELLLLAHKSFTVNPTDARGVSHLHVAYSIINSSERSIEIIKLLFRQDNVKDDFGKTALSIAALNDNKEAVQLLLNYGIDVDHSLLKKIIIQLKNHGLPVAGSVLEVFVMHLEKLLLISYPVSRRNQRICTWSKLMTPTIMRHWRKELEMLEKHKIDDYTTLYDILFKTKQQMARHVRNTNFENQMDFIDAFNVYPNYRFLLDLKFREGLSRSRILEQATASFRFLIKKENFPESCVDYVFDCLSDKELKKLILAVG